MEKVVDKAASIALGCRLIICGRSVKWWDEEIRQPVKDCRPCFAQGLGNDTNWNEYFKIRRELKEKIRDKRKNCKEEVMNNVKSTYRKNMNAFWKFVKRSIKSSAKIRIETLTDDSSNSFASHRGKVQI